MATLLLGNMKKAIFKEGVLPVLLIALGVMMRFLPHPANFAPIGAIAVFGGMYLPKRVALIVPLLAVLASDFFIGFYDWKIMLSVYGGFLLMGVIGLFVRKHKKVGNVIGGTLLGSLSFFLITNAAVWMFGAMYASDFAGLMQSYFMALPFFLNSVLGDLFYVGVLVGGMELVLRLAAPENSQARRGNKFRWV